MKNNNLIKNFQNPNNWAHTDYFIILFVFYSIANGLILFSTNSIYWDDLSLYSFDDFQLEELYSQHGDLLNFKFYFHKFLLNIGPWIYKIIRFFVVFFTAIPLDHILKRQNFIEKNQRILIVLFFLILPISFDKVLIITLPNSICNFLFFLGWSLLFKNKLISSILFLLSFNTNSFLVFYFLPLLESFMASKEQNLLFRKLILFLKNKFIIVLLPFIYFSIDKLFFPPYGIYEGYKNNFGIFNLIKSPIYQINEIIETPIALIPVIVLSTLIYKLLISKLNLKIIKTKDKFKNPIFILGTLAFLLACFPYWILGLIPSFSGWGTRHQLLMPLGASLLIVYFLSSISRNNLKPLLSLIISVCIVLNISTYLSLNIDHQKQKQLINLFQNNLTYSDVNVILIHDDTKNLNAWNRDYRFYEWNSLIKIATNAKFNEEDKPMIFSIGIDNYKDRSGFEIKHFDKLFMPNEIKSEYLHLFNVNPINILNKEISIKDVSFFYCKYNNKSILEKTLNKFTQYLPNSKVLEKQICIKSSEIKDRNIQEYFRSKLKKIKNS